MAGWPIFAEWAKLKSLPRYGGNKIPESYLKRFLPSGGNAPVTGETRLPNHIEQFAKLL